MSPTLTAAQRQWLSNEVARRRRMIECAGCGELIERTTERRHYCSRACANRHWHVRRKEADPDYQHA